MGAVDEHKGRTDTGLAAALCQNVGVIRSGTPAPQPSLSTGETDDRFRELLGDRAWSALPLSVRRRFSRRLQPGEVRIYRGRVIATELSHPGLILSSLARLIGGPLPLVHGASGPAVVTVSEDARLGGQIWTRLYARPGRFPQVVHSAKRFAGPTGLEEHIGSGITMALAVSVENGALVFRSARYLISVGRWHIALPRWLSPGRMEIVHRQETEDEFSFRLTLVHPLFGRLIHQLGYFRDE